MAVKAQPKIKSPSALAHVVFRTDPSKYEEMVEFWTTFLGGNITHKSDVLAFIRYDDEHHRIAIMPLPGTIPKPQVAAGMDHIAFSFDTLADLLESCEARILKGIHPIWAVNHGPTTSIYYQDPIGNKIETQVDNFESVKEANDFMTSKYFDENPIGVDVDAKELLVRLRNGEKDSVLKKRVEIGKRTEMPEGW